MLHVAPRAMGENYYSFCSHFIGEDGNLAPIGLNDPSHAFIVKLGV